MTAWEKAIAHVGFAHVQYRDLLSKAKTAPATEEQKDAFGRLWSTLEGRGPLSTARELSRQEEDDLQTVMPYYGRGVKELPRVDADKSWAPGMPLLMTALLLS
jgi:hypothetical protein